MTKSKTKSSENNTKKSSKTKPTKKKKPKVHPRFDPTTAKNNRVLSLDASCNSTGYCVYDCDTDKIIVVGKIVPPNEVSNAYKLHLIYEKVSTLIARHEPGAIACEDQFYHVNAQTLMSLSQVRGIIMLSAFECYIPVVLYAPSEIKKIITSKGNATKDEVYQEIKTTYGQDEKAEEWLKSAIVITEGKNKNDDVSDAIAIARTHKLIQCGRLA